jgi:predicted flap endonuclease-1-like 5' DNA nuclease
MPEITVIHIALLATALIVGVIIGWIFRGRRSSSENATINASWQEQMETQRSEQERLLEQNKSLMEQNSQYQVSNEDSKKRAAELSKSLRETFHRRDDLQRQIKDIRNNLELTVSERDQLQNDVQNREVKNDVTSTTLQQRDDMIARLTKDLEGWQERVPPLVERFKIRDEDANRLQRELAAAQLRIVALEATIGQDDTRAEQVDSGALGDGLDASNDPIDPPGDNEDTHGSESNLEPETTAAPTEAEDGSLRDDLKMIKGIGPAIQKTLNEMGIRRFGQIADMSEYDIDRVAQRLKGFRSRIYREDWIGQARDLQNQKLTGQA